MFTAIRPRYLFLKSFKNTERKQAKQSIGYFGFRAFGIQIKNKLEGDAVVMDVSLS